MEISKACRGIPNVHMAHHAEILYQHLYDGLHLNQSGVQLFIKDIKDTALDRNRSAPHTTNNSTTNHRNLSRRLQHTRDTTDNGCNFSQRLGPASRYYATPPPLQGPSPITPLYTSAPPPQDHNPTTPHYIPPPPPPLQGPRPITPLYTSAPPPQDHNPTTPHYIPPPPPPLQGPRPITPLYTSAPPPQDHNPTTPHYIPPPPPPLQGPRPITPLYTSAPPPQDHNPTASHYTSPLQGPELQFGRHPQALQEQYSWQQQQQPAQTQVQSSAQRDSYAAVAASSTPHPLN
ncbi:hypothetical protein ABVT39_022835 [Epinephelus coioides]